MNIYLLEITPSSRVFQSETDIKAGGPVPIRHVKGHVPVPFVKSRASGVILAGGADFDWASGVSLRQRYSP